METTAVMSTSAVSTLSAGSSSPSTVSISGMEEKAHVLDLKPSQFAVGMQQVNVKAEKMEEMGRDEFKEYLKEKTVPVVVGPGGGLHIIDHHHHCCAVLKLKGKKPVVYIRRKEDWSGMAKTEFWAKMIDSKYVWPYNKDGKIVSDIRKELPKDVKGLKNDPYRSMAAIVRQEGKFAKNTTPFAEFQLANYLRSRIKLSSDDDLVKFDKKVIKAALAQVPSDPEEVSKLGLILDDPDHASSQLDKSDQQASQLGVSLVKPEPGQASQLPGVSLAVKPEPAASLASSEPGVPLVATPDLGQASSQLGVPLVVS